MDKGHAVLKPTTNSMFLEPNAVKEMNGLNRKLPNKNSFGDDEISLILMKFCCDELASKLTALVDSAFD